MNTIGFIGLGRMGKNMILHLLEQGINVVGYNRTSKVTDEFASEVEEQPFSLHDQESSGTFTVVYSLADLIRELPSPRVIILMVKAGEAVDNVIKELQENGLATDDILIDGGNSFFEDSKRRFEMLSEKKIHYIDCGTSGGLEGARNGACLMLGGNESIVESLDFLWDALAGMKRDSLTKSGMEDSRSLGGGWTYFGPSGAGHFVKMVHNGIEYGIDQAFGDGFELLEKSPYNLDLEKVAKNWTKGSVVRGWLVELLARAFSKDPKLASYVGRVGGGQTGQWTIDTAKKLGITQPILEEAMRAREKSQETPSFAGKVVSALRYEYGGHKEESK